MLHRHKLCGYEWKVRPNNLQRAQGPGCPNCGKFTKLTHSDYISKLENKSSGFIPLELYAGSDNRILHKHIKCGHEWKVRLHDILRGQNCPKCSQHNYSKIAIEWLNSFNNPNIQHAENGGEISILGYKVDGYDPITNIVYEFHGDAYHGNLERYSEDHKCHPFNKNITALELFESTYERMFKLSEVATVVYIWEKDYKEGKSYEQITQR